MYLEVLYFMASTILGGVLVRYRLPNQKNKEENQKNFGRNENVPEQERLVVAHTDVETAIAKCRRIAVYSLCARSQYTYAFLNIFLAPVPHSSHT